MILGVWYPEPIVSAQVWTDIAVTLESSPNINQIIYLPKPSRPIGYSFDGNLRTYKNINTQIVNSYVANSSKLFDRLLESLSFSFASSFKLLFKSNIDLVVNNSWWLPGRFIIALTCNFKKIPYLTSVQDIYPEALTSKIGKGFIFKILKYFDIYTLKNANHIITIDEKMAVYLSKSRNINTNKITSIKNWTYQYEFSNPKSNTTTFEKSDFVYLGNLGQASGLEDFLIKIPLDWKFTIKIGGSGTEYEKLEKIIVKRKLINIEIMQVKTNETDSFLNSAKYALLVVDENIKITSVPSKYLAYVKYNLPVLCVGNKNSIIADEILQNKTGYVCTTEELFSQKNLTSKLNFKYDNENFKNNNYKDKYLKILCK